MEMSNINTRSKRIKSSFSRSSKMLMSLYNKSSSIHHHHHHHHSMMMKPPPSKPTTAAAVAPPPNSASAFIILNQDQLQVYPQKVALVVPDWNRHHVHDSCGKLETYHGLMGEDDEAVDDKAAKYITDVQERFRSA